MKKISLIVAGILVTSALLSFSFHKKPTHKETAKVDSSQGNSGHFVLEPLSQF